MICRKIHPKYWYWHWSSIGVLPSIGIGFGIKNFISPGIRFGIDFRSIESIGIDLGPVRGIGIGLAKLVLSVSDAYVALKENIFYTTQYKGVYNDKGLL